MTVQTALWVFGLSVIPVIGFCFWLYVTMRDIKADTQDLMVMHQNPDAHGFGTNQLEKVIGNLATATNAMAHYTKWMAEKLTGETPPPPTPKIGEM